MTTDGRGLSSPASPLPPSSASPPSPASPPAPRPDAAPPRLEPALRLLDEVARLVPAFLQDPVEMKITGGGNAAFSVIDANGTAHGRVFGTDKTKGRGYFITANRKALQVWMTGYATGRFEELVYSRQLDDKPFGIIRPDFIGWGGGVPFRSADGSMLAAAFSGFRGEKDVEILMRAAAEAGLEVWAEGADLRSRHL